MSTPPGPPGASLPPPPSSFPKGSSATRRRPAMIGLAIILIVGAAAVAGLLAVRVDNREPVLVAARAISVGQAITAEDLAVQRVAGDGLSVLPSSASRSVIGSFASQNIPQGRLLDNDMLSDQGFLKTGTVAVGVALAPGRMPASGLSSGDVVQVVQVADGKATVLVESAVVSRGPASDTAASGGSFLGGGGAASTDTSSSGVATLIVSPDVAPAVAAASAANQVAVILITRGGS